VKVIKKDAGVTIKIGQRQGDLLTIIPGNPDRAVHPAKLLISRP